MKTVQEIRLENLKWLVADAAGPEGDSGKGLTRIVELAAQRGKKLSRPTLYQILTNKKTSSGGVRNVGDDIARDIEDALKLERGWMDNEHGAQAATESALPFTPEEIADMVAVFCATNEMGRQAIKAAVNLARDSAPADSVGNQPQHRGTTPLGITLGRKI